MTTPSQYLDISRIPNASPYQNLAAAIVQRALLDATGKPPRCRLTKADQENAQVFLQSWWCLWLLEMVTPMDVDTDVIVDRLREAA